MQSSVKFFSRIGDVSRLTGLSASSLRKYERLGIVLPGVEPSGLRLYSRLDVDWLLLISKEVREKRTSPQLIIAFLRHIPQLEIRKKYGMMPCELVTAGQICWQSALGVSKSHRTKCNACPVYQNKATMLNCGKYYELRIRKGVRLPEEP